MPVSLSGPASCAVQVSCSACPLERGQADRGFAAHALGQMRPASGFASLDNSSSTRLRALGIARGTTANFLSRTPTISTSHWATVSSALDAEAALVAALHCLDSNSTALSRSTALYSLRSPRDVCHARSPFLARPSHLITCTCTGARGQRPQGRPGCTTSTVANKGRTRGGHSSV